MAIPSDWLPIAFAIAIVIGIMAAFIATRHWRRWRLRRRFKRGAQGESKALKFLVQHGFEIESQQAKLRPTILIDNREATFEIRADFIVRKKGRRGVVDAKTGTLAINPCTSASRRQLLEYAHYYDVDDVYLFDAEHKKLMNISFGNAKTARRLSGVIYLIFGILFGAAAMYWVSHAKIIFQ